MTRLRPAPHAQGIPYDGGVVILDPRGTRLSAGNPTAALLWARLAEGAAPDDLVATLVGVFGGGADRYGADVAAILARWREDGLLADAADAASPAVEPEPAPEPDAAPGPSETDPVQTIALGAARIALRADRETGAQLRPWLAHLETDEAGPALAIELGPAGDGTHRLMVGGRERFRTDDIGQLLGGVCQAILEAAHPGTGWLAWIHGGAVVGEGGAVVLPGRSGSGKSTLIAHLLTRGLRLLTDDVIALTAPDGRVVPWPMPLSLKPGSWAALAEGYPALDAGPVATFRGKTERLVMPPPSAWAPGPAAARALCFPRYRAGAATRLTPLPPLAALERLLGDRCHLGAPMTVAGVRAFLDWLARVPAHALDYSDLGEAGACIGTLLPP